MMFGAPTDADHADADADADADHADADADHADADTAGDVDHADDDHASAPTEPAPDSAASAKPAPDPTATAAAAVNQLSPTELQSFLDQLSPAHKRAFEQKFGTRDSVNTNVEIAELARASRALLAHAQQNADDIRSRLTRIIRLTGLEGINRREAAAKSNAQLDRGAFARGMGLAGQPGKTFPTMTMTPDGVDELGQPSYGLAPAGRSTAH